MPIWEDPAVPEMCGLVLSSVVACFVICMLGRHSSKSRCCGICGYDLSGLDLDRVSICPECGRETYIAMSAEERARSFRRMYKKGGIILLLPAICIFVTIAVDNSAFGAPATRLGQSILVSAYGAACILGFGFYSVAYYLCEYRLPVARAVVSTVVYLFTLIAIIPIVLAISIVFGGGR